MAVGKGGYLRHVRHAQHLVARRGDAPELLAHDWRGATADAIAVEAVAPDSDPRSVLWYPASGREQRVGPDCGLGMAGARTALVVVDCHQRSVDVLDAQTGRVRRLPIPRGLVADGVLVVMSRMKRILEVGVVDGDVEVRVRETQIVELPLSRP